jgi:ribonuclease HI
MCGWLENEDKEKVMIKIYCDGGCKSGNSGSGICVVTSEHTVMLYGAYSDSGTNNTAELLALYKALEISKSYKCKVTIYSDSQYANNSITSWSYNWRRNGWRKNNGEIISNRDIIIPAHELYTSLRSDVYIQYVKAHAGIIGNELADIMATHAMNSMCEDYKIYRKGDKISQILSMRLSQLDLETKNEW